MDGLQDAVNSANFLGAIALGLMLFSGALALLIAAFGPPNVNRDARAYYQASAFFVAFRIWYAATYEIRFTWWGNLVYANWLVATVVLTAAVVTASTRHRESKRNDHA